MKEITKKYETNTVSRDAVNEMEVSLEDSFTACRDNDHDTVAIISQAVSEVIKSTKPKKHSRFPNKQRAELKKFSSNGYRHSSDEDFKERIKTRKLLPEQLLSRTTFGECFFFGSPIKTVSI